MSNTKEFAPSIVVFPTADGFFDVVLEEKQGTKERCKIPFGGEGKLRNKKITITPTADFTAVNVQWASKKRRLQSFEKQGRLRFWGMLVQPESNPVTLEEFKSLFAK